MPPKIDREKCESCGSCVFACGKYVFSFRLGHHGVMAIKAKDCVNCFICQETCPVGAITIKVEGSNVTAM